jgi:2',3'-cyclic-nucleotide 2'-phosphodiesterase (5'-nucleotidase family)
MPFGNLLETFEIDGRGLEAVCLVNARAAEDGDHGILQIAGLRYAYAVEGGEVRLLETTVGGQPLDPDRVYTVACPDYVAMKAELYMDRPVPETTSTGVTITQALIEAVEAAGTEPIDAETDGRIARR